MSPVRPRAAGPGRRGRGYRLHGPGSPRLGEAVAGNGFRFAACPRCRCTLASRIPDSAGRGGSGVHPSPWCAQASSQAGPCTRNRIDLRSRACLPPRPPPAPAFPVNRKEVRKATGMQAEMDRYEAEIQRLRKEPDPTMKVIESAEFNVAAAAASTRERMQDVDGRSAIGELLECAEPVSREWCERTGEAGRGVLADLARTVHLDEMGRPREDTRPDGIRIDPETAWAARRWIEVQAVGNILPAVEIVQERLGSETVKTLERWVERCPTIAEDHRRIAVRAPQAGYEKDLMGFVAFGVPTMEHLLANLMEQAGVVTAPMTRREEPASMQWALEKEEVRTRLGTGGPIPRSSARPDPGPLSLAPWTLRPANGAGRERKRHVEDAR